MSPTRTDDDLERLLRSTLDSRAAAVSSGPGWTGAAHPRARSRWIEPVAAAALVLALVAAFVVLRLHSTETQPVTPPPPSATNDRASFPVPGYAISGTLFAPTYRAVAVRTPGGHTSAAKADAIVFAFGAHGYDLGAFRSQARITVDGHPGFSGTAPAIPNNDHHRVATIVWNYVPGRWALVQSVEGQRAPTTAALRRLAGAAQPTGHLTVATAFRFTTVPAGFHFVRAETLTSLRAVIVELRNRLGSTLTVTSVPVTSKLARGLVADGVVRHGDQLLVVDASGPSAAPTTADKAAAAALRAHVVWQASTLDHVVP